MSDDLKDIHKKDQDAARAELEEQRRESQKVFQSFVDNMVKVTEESIKRRKRLEFQMKVMLFVVVGAALLAILAPALALAWRWFHLK